MSVAFELIGHRLRNGQVLATVRVLEAGQVVFIDGVNLSTVRSRNQFFEGLSQRLNGTCPDQRLVETHLLRLLDGIAAPAEDAASAEGHPGDADDPTGPYRETADGLLWLKPTQHGLTPTLLCNFTARIVGDVLEDDGSGEPRRVFTLVAWLGQRQFRFEVAAERFHAMAWPAEYLGAQAILYPGLSVRDHARTAIQLFSGQVPDRRVLAHTGWTLAGDIWIYLQAGGPIGPVGPLPQIEGHLAAPLDRYVLPAPPQGTALRAAVRASLRALGVAPLTIMSALLGAAFRAVLGSADFSVHLSGPTGEGKTELAALAQQHFGAGMDGRHLPGSWSSTENALEATAFLAKDTLLTIDDFAPTGSQTDTALLHRKADRLFRAQGNGSGRQRMRADTSLRAPRYPRGVMLSTGEDIPRGQSLRGRLVVLELGPGDVRWDRLTVAQRDAAGGQYAAAMAGYIQWLAGQFATIRSQLPAWEQEKRELALASGAHRRTPDNVAKLAAGWTLFLRFAIETAALTEAEADTLYQRIWQALGQTAAAQQQYQQAGEPVGRFFELLRGALAGGLAHVAAPDGSHQLDPRWRPETWGWEFRAGLEGGYYAARGTCIGWLEGEDLYLEPEMSFHVVQRLGRDGSEGVPVGSKTLHRRMAERGVLVSTDLSRGRLTVRKTLGDTRRVVLHVAAGTLLSGGTAQSAHSAHGAERAGAGQSDIDDPVGRLWQDCVLDPMAPGPNGPIGPLPTTGEAGEAAALRCTSCGVPTTRIGASGAPDCGRHDDGPEPPRDPAPLPAPDPTVPQAGAPDGEFRVIRDADALKRALPELLSADLVGLDTETTGLDPHTDRLRLVQLAVPGHVYLVDCFSVDAALLAPLFVQGPRVAGHSLAFDLRFLLANGVPVPHGDRLFDTMLASQLLHAGLPEPAGTHTLAAVVQRYLGETVDKTEQRSDWAGTLSDQQLQYAATDAALLLPLVARLQADLIEADLDRAATLEFRALPALAWLMLSGTPFDSARWQALADGAVAEQIALEVELTAETGLVDLFGESTVNWASPVQVADLLRKRGHSVTTTDEVTLQRLVPLEPLAALLLQYREASKRASTYGIAFLQHVHPVTGRLHADFRQLGAASGRMSCTRPNLQNLPRDPLYRGCVRPRPGRALVKADYSQIELRIAAQLSQDPALLAAYRAGADVHTRTAAAVVGIAETAVTKQQRQLAKALNFGLLYGMGATTLQAYAANDYGVELSETEAQIFRERFFATYPSLRRWHRGQRDGVVETRTLVGRRRQDVSRFTEKLNTPVQGTGADILKLALARLWEDRSGQPSAVPVLCVHDEIVVECDATAAEAVAAWLKRHLEAAGTALLPDVPVIADVSISADWSGTPVRPEEDV